MKDRNNEISHYSTRDLDIVIAVLAALMVCCLMLWPAYLFW